MDMIYLLTRKCLIICLLLLHLHFVASSFRILGLFPINATSAKESTNLQLTINKLQQQYLPNASIDIHTYNKTNKDGTVMKIMLDSFVQPSELTAIIGPGRKKAIHNVNWFLSTIPEKVIQIVYNPVINDDHKEYLHNLAPSVSQVVDVLLDLMVMIKWNYIAIMRDATEFSILSTELLRKKAQIKQICIGLEEEIMRNVDVILTKIKSAEIKGILVFGKKDTVREVSRNLDEKNFRFIFVSNENLHSKDTQEELPNHSLQVMWNGFDDETNSNGNLKYINDAVRMALKWFSICRNFSDCRDLQRDEIINGAVNIYQKVNDKQIQVDIYKNESNIKIEKSFCRTKCENCVLNIIPNPYTLKDGIYKIVLLAPIHRANENDPFVCSRSLHHERIVDLVEAARFAIQTSINPDLGLIIIDSCSQPIITTEKLIRINYTNVLGVIGGYYSMTTIPAAEVLSRLQKPLITYGAESHVLSDRNRFPYVHRTVPSTEEKSKAIILLCKRMEWKAINVMYTKESFGISGQSLLLKYAKIYGICIVNNIEVELGKPNFQIFLNQLRKTRTVKVVVIFLLRDSYKQWLAILNKEQEDNEFHFIDAYGIGNKEDRSVTYYKDQLIIDTNKLPNQEFLDYYKNLTESESVKNPWVKGTIEISNKCRFEGSFNIAYEKACIYQLKVDSVSTYHNLAIKSIYALINGTVCIVSGTCTAETISQKISQTKLNISGKKQRLFDDAGNSFLLYSLQKVKSSNSIKYEKVAAYENGTWEINHWDKLSSFTSICDDSCEDCPTDDTVFIAFITLDFILSLIIIIIAGIFLWKKRNYLRC